MSVWDYVKKPVQWQIQSVERWIEWGQATARQVGLKGGRALTPEELAEIEAEAEAGIRRAAGENKALAEREVVRMKMEVEAVNRVNVEEMSRRGLGTLLPQIGAKFGWAITIGIVLFVGYGAYRVFR